MNVYIISRKDDFSYGDNYRAVIVAKDELHAERLARIEIWGFKKAKLSVTKVDLKQESIISIENVGG